MKSFRPILFLSFLLLVSCNRINFHHVAVFQMNGTNWDKSLHDEMLRESSFFHDLELVFHYASSPEEQVRQIESAFSARYDAFIINPFDESHLLPVVEDLYDRGANIIYVGQKLDSYKYHAYVGLDNYRLGLEAARYVSNALPGGGNVVVIESFIDAPYYKDRHEAFFRELSSRDDINIVASFDAGYDANAARSGLDTLKHRLGPVDVDLVFSFGDGVIRGAVGSNAYPDAIYVDADGIQSNDFQLISNGIVDAAFNNPTGGSLAVDLANSVIHGRSYDKDTHLMPVLVTAGNVEYIQSFCANLECNNRKIDILTERINNDRARFYQINIAFLIGIIITLLLLVLVVVLSCRLAKGRDLPDSAPYIDRPDIDSDAEFMSRFRGFLEEHIGNSDLSVDDMAVSMEISRAQLYRRVKSASGWTPNELLQSTRLEKAEGLLRTTEMNVSEIAYAVGFASPAYFSRCFKDKYGQSPVDIRGGR